MCLDKNTGNVLWERDRHARPDVPEEDKAFRLERWYLWWTKEIDPKNEMHGVCGGFGKEKVRRSYENDIGRKRRPPTDLAALEERLAKAPETWPGCETDNLLGWSCCQTPVSDGTRVVAAFRTGVVVCYDLDGNRQWLHLMLNKDGSILKGEVRGQSPLLAGGKVVIFTSASAAPRGQCFGLDTNTGKEAYNTPVKYPGIRNPVATRKGDTWYACSSGGTVVRADDGAVIGEFPDHAGVIIPGSRRGHAEFIAVCASVDHTKGVFILPGRGIVVPEKRDAPCGFAWRFDPRWVHQYVGKDGAPFEYEDFVHFVQEAGVAKKWIPVKNKTGRVMDIEHTFFQDGDRSFHAEAMKDDIVYNFGSARMSFSARDAITGDLLYVHNYYSDKDMAEGKIGTGMYYGADVEVASNYVFVPIQGGIVVVKCGRQYEFVDKKKVPGKNPIFDGNRVYLRDNTTLLCIGKDKAASDQPTTREGGR